MAKVLLLLLVFSFIVFFVFKFRLLQENLKRCVRDALARKRMVAFLLLDNPQESIMDLMVILHTFFLGLTAILLPDLSRNC